MKFKIDCNNCDKKVIPIVIHKKPHLKAMCSECNKFIKFLNKNEKEMYHAME